MPDLQFTAVGPTSAVLLALISWMYHATFLVLLMFAA
jgi:hypothetical protein